MLPSSKRRELSAKRQRTRIAPLEHERRKLRQAISPELFRLTF